MFKKDKTFLEELKIFGLLLLFGVLFSVFFHKGSSGTWLGEFPWFGFSILILISTVIISYGATNFRNQSYRILPLLVFFILFYQAASSGVNIIERLQTHIQFPHVLLILFVAVAPILFQSKESFASLINKQELQKESEIQTSTVIAKVNPFDRIIGQGHVIAPLKEIASIAKSGIRVGKRNAPHAVIMFLGPTGVGKTEAARALAEAVYGSENSLIRFDMGQFTDSSHVVRFYGPPPGYVGSKEGGQLTRAVFRNPKSVLLLDEMEKAHPQIWDAFLTVFDEGYIVDGSTNQKVDMTNTIVVLTSNLLSKENAAENLSASELKNKVIEAGRLRPELVGRINEILVFKGLSRESIEQILRKRIDTSLWSLSDQGIKLKLEEKEIEMLIDQVQKAEFGVRQIDDIIRTSLRKKISENTA